MTEAAFAPPVLSTGKSLRTLYRELSTYLPGRGRYLALAVIAVLASFAEAGSLVMLTLAAATVASDQTFATVAGITFSRTLLISGAAALLCVRLALMWWNSRTVVGMATDALVEARRRLLTSFVDARFEHQSTMSPAVLQDLLAARADVVASSFSLVGTVAVASVNLAVLAGMALVLQPLAVLGLAVVAAIMMLALRPLNRRVRRLSEEALNANELLVRRVGDLTANFRDVTAFGVGRRFVDASAPVQNRAALVYRRRGILTNFAPQVYQTAGLLLAVCGLALATALAQRRVAVLGAVVLLLLRSVSYAQQLIGAIHGATDRLPIVLNVSEAIARFRSESREDGGFRPGSLDRLELSGVGYRYPQGPLVLKDINLEIRPGEMVGVVGPSGSGKSTLLQLLCRLREPTEGAIFVGGRPHTDVSHEWWAEHVALVPQDARLLGGTLAENIDFYRALDVERLSAAADDAQLSADLDQIGGMDAVLSYQHRSLSGGQIQRLAIARALAGHPDLLLLDEPTSALDVGTEQRLQRVLDDLHGRVTMLIVAHRLSTVASCDRVVVLSNGEVIADGPSKVVLDEFGRSVLEEWEILTDDV